MSNTCNLSRGAHGAYRVTDISVVHYLCHFLLLSFAPSSATSVCLALSALVFFFRVAHFSCCGARSPYRLSTPIPASSWNYVEFTLHPRCIITDTCAMHAREHHIHTDLQFTGQRPLNDRPRRINRSPPFLRCHD